VPDYYLERCKIPTVLDYSTDRMFYFAFLETNNNVDLSQTYRDDNNSHYIKPTR
jgi:hypothetical protein